MCDRFSGRGPFCPFHQWAAPKKPILNRVNHVYEYLSEYDRNLIQYCMNIFLKHWRRKMQKKITIKGLASAGCKSLQAPLILILTIFPVASPHLWSPHLRCFTKEAFVKQSQYFLLLLMVRVFFVFVNGTTFTTNCTFLKKFEWSRQRSFGSLDI